MLILTSAAAWTAAEVLSMATSVRLGDALTTSPIWQLTVIGYACQAAAVVAMVRTSYVDNARALWLEALVGSVSFVVQWWLMIGHGALTGGPHRPGAVVSSLFSLGGLAVIIPTMALISARAGRDGAARLLALTVTADIAGDLAFADHVAHTSIVSRAMAPGMWLVQGLLLGFAGLHAARTHPRIGPYRVSAVTVAALLAGTVGPLVTLTVRGAWGTPPDHDEAVLTLTASMLMLGISAVRIRGLVQQVQVQADALEHISRTDELTGIPNRRAGVRLLDQALTARPDDASLAIAILDLDHFKRYNDTHGHLAGDRLLERAGERWTRLVDEHGLVYRHGGEEFVVLLRGHTLPQVENLLDRMRAALPDRQSFSAGVTLARPDDDVDSLFVRADQCLYAAKAAGRGITVSAP